jgi:hypothetical protein
MKERASIFDIDNDDGPDLSSFAPRAQGNTVIDRAAIEEVASAKGFTSREPARAVKEGQPTLPPKPSSNAPESNLGSRVPRRFMTGRNRQLNLKVTDDALTRFYALADKNHWVLGEAFEMAVASLELQVSQASNGSTHVTRRQQKA